MTPQKILISFVALTAISANLFAQQEPFESDTSLAERIGIIKQKQDNFQLYFHTHFSGDLLYDKNGLVNGAFRMPEIRIESQAKLTNRLSFRWRQRLNKNNKGSNNVDALPQSIDIAGLGITLSEKWSLFIGKQCAAVGGFEFDLNPIEVYEFSNMGEYINPYLTGIRAVYHPSARHEIQIEVLNSLNAPFADNYPLVEEVQNAKLPFVYTVNWNGRMWDHFSTRWSYSFLPQGVKGSRHYNMHYIALGNQLELGKAKSYFDIMYSNEGLNRKGIISNPYDVEYLSFVLEMRYAFKPQWQFFLKGMYETAGAKGSKRKSNTPLCYPLIMNSYGYSAGIEYYPLVGQNLHFFLTYVGRSHRHVDTRLSKDSHRASLGFIYQIPIF